MGLAILGSRYRYRAEEAVPFANHVQYQKSSSTQIYSTVAKLKIS